MRTDKLTAPACGGPPSRDAMATAVPFCTTSGSTAPGPGSCATPFPTGRREVLGLGSESEGSLAPAHELAQEARIRFREGRDPIPVRNEAALAVLRRMRRQDVAVLLRAMAPLRQVPVGTPPGIPMLLLSGASDSIVLTDNPAWLAAQLMAAGAEVTHRVLPVGHGLSAADVTAASAWLERHAR